MSEKFAEVLITYHKRNGAFIYEPNSAEVLTRILEVVFSKKTAFWLYCVLVETILPLNFYANKLYPLTLKEFTVKLAEKFDMSFFANNNEDFYTFWLKGFNSLFTNLTVGPIEENGKSEMGYLMLDILFLIGDPKQSVVLTDNFRRDGHYEVGECLPKVDHVRWSE